MKNITLVVLFFITLGCYCQSSKVRTDNYYVLSIPDNFSTTNLLQESEYKKDYKLFKDCDNVYVKVKAEYKFSDAYQNFTGKYRNNTITDCIKCELFFGIDILGDKNGKRELIKKLPAKKILTLYAVGGKYPRAISLGELDTSHPYDGNGIQTQCLYNKDEKDSLPIVCHFYADARFHEDDSTFSVKLRQWDLWIGQYGEDSALTAGNLHYYPRVLESKQGKTKELLSPATAKINVLALNKHSNFLSPDFRPINIEKLKFDYCNRIG